MTGVDEYSLKATENINFANSQSYDVNHRKHHFFLMLQRQNFYNDQSIFLTLF